MGKFCRKTGRACSKPPGSVMRISQQPSVAHLSPNTTALPALRRNASRGPKVDAADIVKRTIFLIIIDAHEQRTTSNAPQQRKTQHIINSAGIGDHVASGIFHSPANVTVAA